MLSVLHLTSSNSKHTTVEVYSENSDISCTEGAFATTTDSTKALISQLNNIVVVIILSIYKLLSWWLLTGYHCAFPEKQMHIKRLPYRCVLFLPTCMWPQYYTDHWNGCSVVCCFWSCFRSCWICGVKTEPATSWMSKQQHPVYYIHCNLFI